MTTKGTEKMTFEQHLQEIDALASADGWPADYTCQTGPEAWRDGYEDGSTPAEAWAEERSCAASDVE